MIVCQILVYLCKEDPFSIMKKKLDLEYDDSHGCTLVRRSFVFRFKT